MIQWKAFFIILLLPSASLYSAPLCEKVTISAHPDYAPFHWVHNDVLMGASITVTQDILDEMSVPWETVVVGPWKRILKYAYEGKIDFIPALKKTPEREQFLVYAPTPFYQNPVGIFMRAGSPAITELAQLDGLIGSVNAGDKHGMVIDSFISNQKIVQVHGILNNFIMLDKGRTDYFIIGLKTATMLLTEKQRQDQYNLVYSVTSSVIHNAFSRLSPCIYLLDEFNNRFKQKVDNGTVEQKIEQFNEIWINQKLYVD